LDEEADEVTPTRGVPEQTSLQRFLQFDRIVLRYFLVSSYVILCYGAPSTAHQLCRRQLGVVASCDICQVSAHFFKVY
jgi:hypothetical protein